MKSLSLLFSFTLFLFIPAGAKANVFIEPYLGYEGGRVSTTNIAGTDGSGNLSGSAFGTRLGYMIPLLFAAVDYIYATETTSSMSGGLTDSSATRSSLGVVAGVKIPLLRAYAGYGFADTLKLAPAGSTQTFSGTSLKFGASFTGLPFINLNIEYVMQTYTKFDPNVFSKANASSVLASVSLPWEF